MEKECHVELAQKVATAQERANKMSAILAIWGMGCPHCAMRVQNSLLLINGVVDAYVEHLAGMAWVVFNPDMVTPDMLLDAVAHAGDESRHEYVATLLA
jgi:copper chaperone CopZ